MRTASTWALLIVSAFIMAGCLGSSGADGAGRGKSLVGRAPGAPGTLDISPDWAEIALTDDLLPAHDHKDPQHHEGFTTPNFEILGYDPLVTDYYGRTAGDHACGDTKSRDGRSLSVVHSFGTDVAFVIIDTTDPMRPQKIGEMVMAFTQVYDLAISPDLRWVVLATSPMDAGPGPEAPAPFEKTSYAREDFIWRDACTGEKSFMGPEAGLPYHSGNVLVDISNPRAPNVVDFLFYPTFGAHSVTITEMNGRSIVLSSVPNIPDQASFYVFMEIQTVPTGAGKLVPLSIYQHPNQNVAGPVATTTGMHDGIIAKHPITGQYLAYLAHGPIGLVILDATNPSEPVYLSQWKDWNNAVGDSAPTDPYVHEAMPAPDVWDGRHYTWIGEECIGHPANTPTCLIFGLDTTDPKNPEFVGAWTLPVDVQWSAGLEFSLHYLAISNRTLFATAYHGGVWAIDVSTEEARWEMPSIGVFIPNLVSPKKFDTPPRGLIVQTLYGGYALDNTPTVLDLNVMEDGTLIVWDMHSGVYTVRFDASRPAPATEPWPMGHLAAK